MLFYNYKDGKKNKKESLIQMNEPIKVLYFVDRMLRGGIQSLVIDWISRFDKNKIQVDFLLLDDGIDYELEKTLIEKGCNVYKLKKIWIRQPFDFFKQSKAIKHFFMEHHDYKIVHMHSSSKNYMVLKYAKKYGIPIRIAHAHASDFQSGSTIKKMVGNLLKPLLIKYANYYFACSNEAGRWLFGEKIIKGKKFFVIKNGVDFERFKYDERNRIEIRRHYGINNNDILIGHIGRFTDVKNHSFMVELIEELTKNNNKYKIMFVGDGILKESIENKVKAKNLSDKVIFAGFQSDVSKFLSAFDLFILPSIYEGLGLVLIEAQANGLTCLATKNTIPKEVKINDNFEFIDLNIKDWRKEIEKVNTERNNNRINLEKAGYEINEVINFLESFYLKK